MQWPRESHFVLLFSDTVNNQDMWYLPNVELRRIPWHYFCVILLVSEEKQ